MAIINQNLDPSVKKNSEAVVLGALATGVTALLQVMPYNCVLKGANLAAFGISNSPVYSLSVFRSTAAGLTSSPLGVSGAAQAFGTSGPVGFSIAPPGISLLAGDAVFMITAGSNAAITGGIMSLVISGSADINVFQNTVG